MLAGSEQFLRASDDGQVVDIRHLARHLPPGPSVRMHGEEQGLLHASFPPVVEREAIGLFRNCVSLLAYGTTAADRQNSHARPNPAQRHPTIPVEKPNTMNMSLERIA